MYAKTCASNLSRMNSDGGMFFSFKNCDVSLCFLWTCPAFCHVGVMC